MQTTFYLPQKIQGYLLRLSHYYAATNHKLKNILDSASAYVKEGIDYHNYDDGEIYLHGVTLFLPMEILAEIPPREQANLTTELLTDLRLILDNALPEGLSDIDFQLNDDNDEAFKKSFFISGRSLLAPQSLGIWAPDMIRVFVSHRDKYKKEAQELGQALQPFGFSCFVAHDTIAPMEEWSKKIVNGLQTMEILLAFLTDDFHDSVWTDQEVGFALGNGTPVISVKFGVKDPQGFISHMQALKGDIKELKQTSERLLPVLQKVKNLESRIQTAVVRAFVESPDFIETAARFERMNKLVKVLTDKELQMIIEAYAQNDRLYQAYYLDNKYNRLKNFLREKTGKEFSINHNKIVPESPERIYR